MKPSQNDRERYSGYVLRTNDEKIVLIMKSWSGAKKPYFLASIQFSEISREGFNMAVRGTGRFRIRFDKKDAVVTTWIQRINFNKNECLLVITHKGHETKFWIKPPLTETSTSLKCDYSTRSRHVRVAPPERWVHVFTDISLAKAWEELTTPIHHEETS